MFASTYLGDDSLAAFLYRTRFCFAITHYETFELSMLDGWSTHGMEVLCWNRTPLCLT
jgi:hypothetical protein